MAFRRRETKAGVRYDVEWRMPDRSRRQKTFSSERAARQFAATRGTAAGRPAPEPHGEKPPPIATRRRWSRCRAAELMTLSRR